MSYLSRISLNYRIVVIIFAQAAAVLYLGSGALLPHSHSLRTSSGSAIPGVGCPADFVDKHKDRTMLAEGTLQYLTCLVSGQSVILIVQAAKKSPLTLTLTLTLTPML